MPTRVVFALPGQTLAGSICIDFSGIKSYFQASETPEKIGRCKSIA